MICIASVGDIENRLPAGNDKKNMMMKFMKSFLEIIKPKSL